MGQKQHLRSCSKCGGQVSKTARTCPHCGHPLGFINRIAESKLVLIITGLMGFMGLNGLWFLEVFEDKKISPIDSQVQAPPVNSHKPSHSAKPVSKPVNQDKYITCSSCKGKGSAPCHVCKNSSKPGYILCKRCKGKKKFECSRCYGRGYNTHDRSPCSACEGEKIVTCKRCKGKGLYDCKNCRGGDVRCIRCFGKGKIKVKK